MKIIRIKHQGVPRWAVLKGESYYLMFGDLFRNPVDMDARPHHYDASRLLCPVQPTKILAVGLNYAEHLKEMGEDHTPSDPVIFLKPTSALLAPGGVIEMPRQSERVDYEAELAVVVKARLKNASAEEARAAIWGFTCCNDVTARDLQKKDGQWTRAKGFDTFCPVGPWIDTDFVEADQAIVCRVNGEERQRSTLSQRTWDCAKLLSFISSVMTIEPHDLLTTGTPSGIGPLKDGDEVEVEIEGLGKLVNKVAAQPALH
jgi:2-keto-4-pentenoate hydratase/2-oxohepta-3-ene-1,7-dioic acid hydratase in catechol pathway